MYVYVCVSICSSCMVEAFYSLISSFGHFHGNRIIKFAEKCKIYYNHKHIDEVV